MRVPPSQLLQQFYRLAGANPTVVAWGETATAIKQGVADGLDPSISRARHVRLPRHPRPTSWRCARCPMRRCSPRTRPGTTTLPTDLKIAFDLAATKTQIETFGQIEKARTAP